MSDIEKALTKLREPFAASQISKMCRSTKKDNPKGKCPKCGGYHGLPAVQLDYVGHAMLTHRMLDADPTWTWEPLALDAMGYPAIDKDGGMWIKLTIAGVTRIGYGDAQGKTGGDAMKERIGDALRNAAMRFGAALDLWHKGDLYAGDADDDNVAAKNPPKEQDSGKQEAQPTTTEGKDSEYIERVKEALKRLYGDDKQAALDCVEKETSFVPTGKTEDERVKGLRDFTRLKGKRLEILAHNLEKKVKAAEDVPF